MGKNIVHCGDAGAGGALNHICFSYFSETSLCCFNIQWLGVAKLCNNLSLAISMVGTCEAMNLVSFFFAKFQFVT